MAEPMNFVYLPEKYAEIDTEAPTTPPARGLYCLWDDCDNRADFWRWSWQAHEYLVVCAHHTELGEQECIVNLWIMRGLVKPA